MRPKDRDGGASSCLLCGAFVFASGPVPDRRAYGCPYGLLSATGPAYRAWKWIHVVCIVVVALEVSGCRAPSVSPWDSTNEAAEIPSPAILEKLCAAWTQATTPSDREGIERQYESKALDYIAREIGAALARQGEPATLSVIDFTTFDNDSSAEGVEWARRLTTRLTQDERVTVTKRVPPQEVLEHLKASRSDLYDPGNVPRIGAFLATSYFVYGQLEEELTVHVVSTESCEVVAAVEVCRPCFRKGPPDPTTIWNELQRIQAPASTLAAKVWTGERTYRIGEPVTVQVSVAKPAHVMLISLQQDGRLVQLFPNAFTPSSLVDPERPLLIPPQDADWEIEARPPTGVQRIKVIASSRPMFLTEWASYPSSGVVFRSIEDPNAGLQRTRDLGIRLKESGPLEWAEASWTFEIVP